MLDTIPMPLPSKFLAGDRRGRFIDCERACIGIGDTSGGFLSTLWHSEYDLNTGDIYICKGVERFLVVRLPNIKELSFTFDQNMNPVITYVLQGSREVYLYFYESYEAKYVHKLLATDGRSPYVTIFDTRPNEVHNSKVYVCYIRGNTLYYRDQLDRFDVEYALFEDISAYRLVQFGMCYSSRVNWVFSGRGDYADT